MAAVSNAKKSLALFVPMSAWLVLSSVAMEKSMAMSNVMMQTQKVVMVAVQPVRSSLATPAD